MTTEATRAVATSRRLFVRAAIVAFFAAWIFALVWWYHGWQHWISYNTGSYNTPGTAHDYNFHSGFGSEWIPSVINLVGIGIVFLWHNQCSVAGCYWYARRKTDAGDRACWRHHPVHHSHMTLELLHKRHNEAAP